MSMHLGVTPRLNTGQTRRVASFASARLGWGMLLLVITATGAADPLTRSLPQLATACHSLPQLHPARVPFRSRPVVCTSSMMRGKASAADAELSPSIVALVGFAVPLLGIGLASPLLGLVDTAVVGRCTGSLQLAALAPSVALSDITFYLFRGMGATTTAFVAAAEADGDAARAARAVHTSVVLAALIGVSIGMLLYVGCLPLLRRLSGAASAEILAEARGYVRVRALGMPAGMVFMVLQASFLGGRDWRPPTAAAVVACVANLLADLLLVAKLRWGVVGAAWGTVGAQYGAAATLAYTYARRRRARAPPTATAAAATAAKASKVAEPFLPSRGELAAWARFGLPLTVGQFARCVTFALVTLTLTLTLTLTITLSR
jgi:Na+-driven multidrug efflux pump